MNPAPLPSSATPHLRQQALTALCATDIEEKVALALALTDYLAPDFVANAEAFTPPACWPGRPPRPNLTHPAKVPRRSPVSLAGRAALIHAIAHIEFNAINLALDAIWRFDGLPQAFYQDWALVAREEAYHFTLLRDHLRALREMREDDSEQQWDYGDFEAHSNLWDMCDQTRHDVVARMALVPRTLEARGLDATPQIQAKLRQVGTPDAIQAVALLDIILRDEVGHVAIGNHWFRWLCARDGLDPLAHDALLQQRHGAPRLKPPFNRAARQRAGFSEQELTRLGCE